MTKYSQSGQRKLSRFHAEEMIYEYCTGALDPIRHKLVEEAIASEPTLQMDLKRVRQALKYCEELSGWPITLKDTEALKGVRTSPIDLIIEKTRIQQWPSGLRLGLESLVVVTAIFSVSILVPWNKLMDALQTEKGTFTIAEIRRDFKTNGASPTEIAAAEDATPVYDDEGFPEEEARRLGRPVADAMQIVLQIVVPPAPIKPEISEQPVKAVPRAVASEKESKVSETKIAGNQSEIAKTKAKDSDSKKPEKIVQAVTTSSEESNEEATETPTGPGSSQLRGLLYRGRIDVTNVEAITPKLVQSIDELGGRKAGNVPLGWRNDSGGSYFHLTLPEAKYEDLKKLFNEFGGLKIEKHTHGRVMPEGIIRLIIEVKEKKPTEGKARLASEGPKKDAGEMTEAKKTPAQPAAPKAPAETHDDGREPAADEAP